MKLVHISDIHIHGENILGHDPVANFKACLDNVAEFHSDADRIVITGDLNHRGTKQCYERLKTILDDSPLKGHLTPRLLIGNHDDRAVFRSVFTDAVVDDSGHIQWTENVPGGRFIYMDTAEKGSDAGHYGEDRREWLANALDQARDDGVSAWLFMHHNPAPVHVANADHIGLVDEAAFLSLITDYRDVVRHIFFGHCHFSLSGVVDGIPFSATRSTCHTCWPDFSGIVDRMGYGDLAPNYNVCFINERSTVVHSIDFLDQDKVKWVKD